MKNPTRVSLGTTLAILAGAAAIHPASAVAEPTRIKQVLLISIDGMHAVDFANCAKGMAAVNGGAPYCPQLAALAKNGVNYLQASATKPSDSFPGSAALATGASPRTSGFLYDVSYDRALSPPAQTTPYGITGGANLCPGTVGTQVGFDEQIDVDYTQLNGGGGINPAYLPRDPKNDCAPVYPHSFLRVNTVFEVIHQLGGYTAWSDKHPAYDFYNGPSGKGVDDFWSPEINSNVVPLPQVPGCATIPDTAADQTAWTNSFQNIRCYDGYKVQTVNNWIHGLTHDGSQSARVPTLFGMNFQAVSVGQKLVESGTKGGYLDALGTPSPSLLGEIQFVDQSIGSLVAALKSQHLADSTLIIVTAKHGQSPIDPARVLRIPHDAPSMQSPGDLLGSSLVAQAMEDDVSLLWLNDQSKTTSAVATLASNLSSVGGGEIFAGNALNLMFNDPATDSRTPDIIVAPNVGVVYTGGGKKIAEHGGFSNDDTHVMLLVSNPGLFASAKTITGPVETRQVAPTILGALRLPAKKLDAVKLEGTSPLPGLELFGDADSQD
ncbi:alkaline phosphatase family protein [Rudaea sp.]|uniref:alkaline phosphatase family protein n=1 Tax=Rudaea sp. TaxID=2136325 RepID=UPI002ED4F1D4